MKRLSGSSNLTNLRKNHKTERPPVTIATGGQFTFRATFSGSSHSVDKKEKKSLNLF